MNTKKGYFLIEALLSIVIFSVLVLSIFSMISFVQNRATRSNFDSEAALLLQEGTEIAHSVLLGDWENYGDAVYFPLFNATTETWELKEGEENNLHALFSRKIELMKVCRDSSTGNILSTNFPCEGQIDPNSRIVKTTITWLERGVNKEISAQLLVLKTE